MAETKDGSNILLGEGRFSFVYEGHELTKERKKVAMKLLAPFKYGDKEGQSVARREQLMDKLNHPNIIKLLHKKCLKVYKDKDEYLIWLFVMNYCQYNIATFFYETKPIEQIRLDLLLQLTRAISYLHDSQIVHRDIKPDNVLILKQDSSPILQLADFGLAEKVTDPSSKLKHKAGTQPFMSPEVFGEEGYSLPADVFASALVFLASMVCNTTCSDKDCTICKFLCLFKGKLYLSNIAFSKYLDNFKSCIIRVLELGYCLVHNVSGLCTCESFVQQIYSIYYFSSYS